MLRGCRQDKLGTAVVSIMSSVDSRVPHERLILIALLAAAFLARLGVRMAFGEEYFWKNSYYSYYYTLAENIVSGNGFCFAAQRCTHETPLYPLFLALTVLAEKNY